MEDCGAINPTNPTVQLAFKKKQLAVHPAVQPVLQPAVKPAETSDIWTRFFVYLK
jgi:hypothetical protein